MGHPFRPPPVFRWIEIGVEHAGPAELKLDADPLANLESRLAKALAKLAGGHADQVASDFRRLLGRPDRLGRRGPDDWTRGACRDREKGDKKETTHRRTMAAPRRAGKLAAARRAR